MENKHSDLPIHSQGQFKYSRTELLSLRRTSYSTNSQTLHQLKLCGLLRYRGKRAGRRRIPVVINRFPRYTVHREDGPSYRRLYQRDLNLTPVPYMHIPRHPVDMTLPPLKLCCLNTRSVKSISADFLDYVSTSRADIFALTETWFTELDTAHKIEITPPGFKLKDRPRTGRLGGKHAHF